MPGKAYVIGVGMTKFEKPGTRPDWDYPAMARESGTKALEDAGISYDRVEAGYVGFMYADSTAGQRALYELGSMLSRRGDQDRAWERLREALRIFERLGARLDMERTEQALAELPVLSR